MQEFSQKSCAGFFAAVMSVDLTDTILAKDRMCSIHYISGKPASHNPNWVPTLNTGKSKELTEKKARAALIGKSESRIEPADVVSCEFVIDVRWIIFGGS